MANSTYRIVAYGNYEHGFYNRPLYKSRKDDAIRSFENCKADPEIDGAVLIEVKHEDWVVIDEFDGGYPVSVEYGPLGNFKVTKSPELVIV